MVGLWHGDNLEVTGGMDAGSVDLIYLDPPFGTGKDWGAFDDRWQDAGADGIAAVARRYHSPAMAGYLAFMEPRLIECCRVLKPTGSIYLHCDPTASHYLKLLMDAVLGIKSFRNELIWHYPAAPCSTARDFPRKHDVILRYACGKFTFNGDNVRVPYSDASQARARYPARASSFSGGETIHLNPLGKLPPSCWVDIGQAYRRHTEHLSYPTQKPVALLSRIVKASSNPGEVVMDPFCGSGTALVAAQSLGRQWIGIDSNRDACEIAAGRLSTMFETVSVQAA